MGIIDRRIEVEIDWSEVDRLDIIGIDEISLKKGHQNYVTIVTGHIEGKVLILGVLKDKEKNTVKVFLKSIPKRIRRKVKAVCSDMYEGFINAAKEVFSKKVRIVIDRFHVAKLYRGCLDKLRVKELKRLKKELPEQEYKKLSELKLDSSGDCLRFQTGLIFSQQHWPSCTDIANQTGFKKAVEGNAP